MGPATGGVVRSATSSTRPSCSKQCLRTDGSLLCKMHTTSQSSRSRRLTLSRSQKGHPSSSLASTGVGMSAGNIQMMPTSQRFTEVCGSCVAGLASKRQPPAISWCCSRGQLRGQHGAECPRFFALLSHTSFSPKFQDWTLRVPDMEDRAQECGQPLLNFPLVLCLQCVPLPIHIPGIENLSLRHETSDDLARLLSMQAQKWRLRVCTYVLLSPMKMQVTGFETAPAFDIHCGGPRAARAAGGRKPDQELLAQLDDMAALNDLQDPFSELPRGRRSSQAPRRERPPQRQATSSTSAAVPPASLVDEPEPETADDADIFGAEDGDNEDEEHSQAHLLAAPPPVDDEPGRLSKDVLIEAVPQLDLMGDECAEEDVHLPPPFGLGEAGVGPTSVGATPASTSASSGGPTSDANAAHQVDMLAELLGEIVGMSEPGQERDAPVVEPAMPSASSSSASSIPGPPSTANDQQPEEATAGGLAMPPPPPPPAALVGDAIPEAPEGWSMTVGGYVFFEQGRYRGRITAFRTNVSVKCATHGCSKMKGRSKVTDGQLCHWLKLGVDECAPSAEAPVKQQGAKHVSLWRF